MGNDRSYEIVQMFYLTQGEKDKGDRWIAAHDEDKRHPGGAIGGLYTWYFTPTSIGVACTVQCMCGEKIDVTNYDLW
jgi:hypothetical protein